MKKSKRKRKKAKAKESGLLVPIEEEEPKGKSASQLLGKQHAGGSTLGATKSIESTKDLTGTLVSAKMGSRKLSQAMRKKQGAASALEIQLQKSGSLPTGEAVEETVTSESVMMQQIKNRFIERMIDQIGQEKTNSSAQKKGDTSSQEWLVPRPRWRRLDCQESITEKQLEQFAFDMQNFKTENQLYNYDPYGIMADKTVQYHKLSSKKIPQGLDVHEERFRVAPGRLMPDVHSKYKTNSSNIEMKKSVGRKNPIYHMQNVKSLDKMYDYHIDSSVKNPLSKDITFSKLDRWHCHDGLFGDAFNPLKKNRFGSPIESSLNMNKVYEA